MLLPFLFGFHIHLVAVWTSPLISDYLTFLGAVRVDLGGAPVVIEVLELAGGVLQHCTYVRTVVQTVDMAAS